MIDVYALSSMKQNKHAITMTTPRNNKGKTIHFILQIHHNYAKETQQKIKPVLIKTLKPKYKPQLYHSNRQAKNIPPYSCACTKPRTGFPTSHVVVLLKLHEWRWEVIVPFVDIGRNVHHHCLNFSLTINNRYFRYYQYWNANSKET